MAALAPALNLLKPRHAVSLAYPDKNSFNAAVAKTWCGAARASGHNAVLALAVCGSIASEGPAACATAGLVERGVR